MEVVEWAFRNKESLKKEHIDDIRFFDISPLAKNVKQMKKKFDFCGKGESNSVD